VSPTDVVFRDDQAAPTSMLVYRSLPTPRRAICAVSTCVRVSATRWAGSWHDTVAEPDLSREKSAEKRPDG